jgi:serine/threonine protein kinase
METEITEKLGHHENIVNTYEIIYHEKVMETFTKQAIVMEYVGKYNLNNLLESL